MLPADTGEEKPFSSWATSMEIFEIIGSKCQRRLNAKPFGVCWVGMSPLDALRLKRLTVLTWNQMCPLLCLVESSVAFNRISAILGDAGDTSSALPDSLT